MPLFNPYLDPGYELASLCTRRMIDRLGQAREIAVIGIGQSLRGDDAAGLEAVKTWRYQYRASSRQVRLELAEVPGIGLLNLMIGANAAILVDAVKCGSAPGTIYHIAEDQIEAFDYASRSAHGWGVAETLSMGRSLYSQSMPETVLILGIEIESLEMGAPLSQPVQVALPELIRSIEEQVQSLLSLGTPAAP